MNGKIKKVIKKLIIMLVISIVVNSIFWLTYKSETETKTSQYLENIDYQVTVNKDGSMSVEETWDIYVSGTNTLFKTFDISPSKYSGITDVKVKEITNGKNKNLTKINEEMYHVTKDCYYGLNTSSYEFEIAWGIGMDHQFGRRQYQVSYVVEDVVTDYKDCQEIYWQFLAEGQNAVPARKVTGTITLPEDVANTENLRVWGHGPLNGEINKINNHEVEFNVNNLSAGAMLEIRVITEDKMFNVNNNKIKPYRNLSNTLKEETDWSDDANEKANSSKKIRNIFIGIYILIIVIYIFKIKKVLKISKQEKPEKIRINFFRDIPRDGNATPAEATYLYKFDKKRLDTGSVQKDAISATILDLCLKKKISLRASEKGTVYAQVIGDSENLNKDELAIYNLLKKVGKEEEFKLSELNKFARKKYSEYSIIINKLVNEARNSLYKQELIDKAEEKLYAKSEYSETIYKWVKNIYTWLIINYILILIPFFRIKIITIFGINAHSIIGYILAIIFPFICEWLYYLNLQSSIRNKIAVLTPKGNEEKAQWIGLANFMQELSSLDKKTVPELVLWEKYLVYATAFGIADKVIEQMKATYPEVFIKERWESENMAEKYPIINFSANPIYYYTTDSSPIRNIGGSVSNAYHTSMTEIARHSSSSRKWRRRRLLRWRRRPAVAGGRNGRQIKRTFNFI